MSEIKPIRINLDASKINTSQIPIDIKRREIIAPLENEIRDLIEKAIQLGNKDQRISAKIFEKLARLEQLNEKPLVQNLLLEFKQKLEKNHLPKYELENLPDKETVAA